MRPIRPASRRRSRRAALARSRARPTRCRTRARRDARSSPHRDRATGYPRSPRPGRHGRGAARARRRIGRDVAIKRMRAAPTAPSAIARFLREARVQGRLEHPAIVPVYDLGRDADGRPYFTMKRLAGTTLAEVLERATSRAVARSACCARSSTSASRSTSRTRAASSTAISSRRTSCSATSARCTCSTGASRASLDDARRARDGVADIDDARRAATRRRRRCSARPATCRPSRSRGDATSTRRADVYALGCDPVRDARAASRCIRAVDAALATHADGVDARAVVRAPERDVAARARRDRASRAARARRDARRDRARARRARRALPRRRSRPRAAAASSPREHARSARAPRSRSGDDADDARTRCARPAARSRSIPTSREAAELVDALMLRAAEARAARGRADARGDRSADRARRAGSRRCRVGYLAFVPLMLWTGMRQPLYAVGFAALAITGGSRSI